LVPFAPKPRNGACSGVVRGGGGIAATARKAAPDRTTSQRRAGVAKTSYSAPGKFGTVPKNRTIVFWYQKLAATAQILD
jgi:hypothetical protein